MLQAEDFAGIVDCREIAADIIGVISDRRIVQGRE